MSFNSTAAAANPSSSTSQRSPNPRLRLARNPDRPAHDRNHRRHTPFAVLPYRPAKARKAKLIAPGEARIFHAVTRSKSPRFHSPEAPKPLPPPIQSDIRTRVFGEAKPSCQSCIAITLGRQRLCLLKHESESMARVVMNQTCCHDVVGCTGQVAHRELRMTLSVFPPTVHPIGPYTYET